MLMELFNWMETRDKKRFYLALWHQTDKRYNKDEFIRTLLSDDSHENYYELTKTFEILEDERGQYVRVRFWRPWSVVQKVGWVYEDSRTTPDYLKNIIPLTDEARKEWNEDLRVYWEELEERLEREMAASVRPIPPETAISLAPRMSGVNDTSISLSKEG